MANQWQADDKQNVTPMATTEEYKEGNKLIHQDSKNLSTHTHYAREEFLETFGILGNVKMKAAEYRQLVETYGEDLAKETIDDLSCKIADGSVDSSNHHATVLGWLRYQRRNGGPVPMTSTVADPMNEKEKLMRIAWKATDEKGRQEYLDDHEGLLPWEYERKHQQP